MKAGDCGELDEMDISIYPSLSVHYIVSKLTNPATTQQSFGGYGTNNALIMRWD
jgi:hypothetical protein